MQKIKNMTFSEHMEGYIKAVETMSQAQIDACAWAMGGSGVGWTRENLIQTLRDEQSTMFGGDKVSPGIVAKLRTF